MIFSACTSAVSAHDLNELAKSDSLNKVKIISNSLSNDTSNQVFTASGNVTISYPLRHLKATAITAKYFIKERKIVLIGNVVMNRGISDSVKADQLTYFFDEDRLIADSHPSNQVLTKVLLDLEQLN